MSASGDCEQDGMMEVDGTDDEGSQASRSTSPREERGNRRPGTTWGSASQSASEPSPNDSLGIHSPGSPYPLSAPRTASSVSIASLLRHPVVENIRPYSREAVPLTQDEARLVHHYSEHLGRWLDCTDATRQFTLGVPEKVKFCPVLCHAVLSFAARHRKEDATADAAYQRCIALLIDRLNEPSASHNETLLCAIVILRFYEQLNGILHDSLRAPQLNLAVPSSTGSDAGQHLAGSSAILRASQGNHYLDPSAPSLREAAFWVYVRQCLYTATINQQPPDVDFSLQLHPTPGSMQDSHPLARLRLETAWANQITWNTALIVNFCFERDPSSERNNRVSRWHELWELVQSWSKDRPEGFDAIWYGPASEIADSCFPQMWFTADWHGMCNEQFQ